MVHEFLRSLFELTGIPDTPDHYMIASVLLGILSLLTVRLGYRGVKWLGRSPEPGPVVKQILEQMKSPVGWHVDKYDGHSLTRAAALPRYPRLYIRPGSFRLDRIVRVGDSCLERVLPRNELRLLDKQARKLAKLVRAHEAAGAIDKAMRDLNPLVGDCGLTIVGGSTGSAMFSGRDYQDEVRAMEYEQNEAKRRLANTASDLSRSLQEEAKRKLAAHVHEYE